MASVRGIELVHFAEAQLIIGVFSPLSPNLRMPMQCPDRFCLQWFLSASRMYRGLGSMFNPIFGYVIEVGREKGSFNLLTPTVTIFVIY